MSGYRYSWSNLGEGRWGVKVAGDLGTCGRLQGNVVAVTARSGRTKNVTLGKRIDCWNGGRAAVYEVAR